MKIENYDVYRKKFQLNLLNSDGWVVKFTVSLTGNCNKFL